MNTDSDMRGTVASLAQEIEEKTIAATKRFSAGPYTTQAVDRKLQADLVQFYQNSYPDAHVVDRGAPVDDLSNANFLVNRAKFYSYIYLDGRRLTPSSSLTNASDSIIQAKIGDVHHVGQVFKIIGHKQESVDKKAMLLDVRWFRPLEVTSANPWAP